ncbi:hypothetical protein B0H14DRAFT_3619447 [Mycena olivaceomarginata]|nr:hypothetical protein B0H14DRAFT_3619447 [Mycena olivaceomarginata]
MNMQPEEYDEMSTGDAGNLGGGSLSISPDIFLEMKEKGLQQDEKTRRRQQQQADKQYRRDIHDGWVRGLETELRYTRTHKKCQISQFQYSGSNTYHTLADETSECRDSAMYGGARRYCERREEWSFVRRWGYNIELRIGLYDSEVIAAPNILGILKVLRTRPRVQDGGVWVGNGCLFLDVGVPGAVVVICCVASNVSVLGRKKKD